jgi:hypothetical protein
MSQASSEICRPGSGPPWSLASWRRIVPAIPAIAMGAERPAEILRHQTARYRLEALIGEAAERLGVLRRPQARRRGDSSMTLRIMNSPIIAMPNGEPALSKEHLVGGIQCDRVVELEPSSRCCIVRLSVVRAGPSGAAAPTAMDLAACGQEAITPSWERGVSATCPGCAP